MVDFLTTVSEGSGKAQTDELRQNGHEEYGEKYRVDRRKLELMLRGKYRLFINEIISYGRLRFDSYVH